MAYKRVDNKTFPFFVTVSDFTNPTFLAYKDTTKKWNTEE